ncbi:hypothetical protein [Polaromonas sp. JS666]|uniref:hypothetical protein n=1 Tax=Polaromonas sp. (strain JS666 / ATCC BAA-500) TaxID=296591 RepID=UPI0000464971|nr:hypothetical protein [Polaromonas sp. JS666]ABE43255.1 hypothetical protein Bpro_1305 [Polaromonas sp. JS666]
MQHYSDRATPFSGFAIRTRRMLLCGIREKYLYLDETRRILGNDVSDPCPRCDGTGLADAFSQCSHCAGYGMVYAISLDELERRREAVLALFPDAGVQGWQPTLTPRW